MLVEMPHLKMLSIPKLAGNGWQLGCLTSLELSESWFRWSDCPTRLPDMPYLQSLSLVFTPASSPCLDNVDPFVDFDRFGNLSHLKIDGLRSCLVFQGRAAELKTLELISTELVEPTGLFKGVYRTVQCLILRDSIWQFDDDFTFSQLKETRIVADTWLFPPSLSSLSIPSLADLSIALSRFPDVYGLRRPWDFVDTALHWLESRVEGGPKSLSFIISEWDKDARSLVVDGQQDHIELFLANATVPRLESLSLIGRSIGVATWRAFAGRHTGLKNLTLDFNCVGEVCTSAPEYRDSHITVS